MKKHLIRIFVITLALLLSGCVKFPEVDNAFKQADHEVSKRFENIGLDQMLIVEPINEKYEYTLEQPFTGDIYILISKEQIEEDFGKEGIFLNAKEFETIKEGSEDDFNIRYKGKSYFSIKKIKVDSISDLRIQTTAKGKFILVFAK